MFRAILAGLLLLSLAACVATVGGAPEAAKAPPSTTTRPSATMPPPVGTYAPGDCLVVTDGITPAKCAEPHDYEVFLSAALPAGVPATYPPELTAIAGPACRDAMPGYTGSVDVQASRLEAAFVWPSEPEWTAGDRWFACLLTEDNPDGDPVRRTGSLREVLADGLGDFRQCLEGNPSDPGPSRTVPCDQPHRSEAVTPVVTLGKVTDPVPTQDAVIAKVFDPCHDAVTDYLGGERPGVGVGWTFGSPEQWAAGYVTATCFATVDTPVTGLMGK